MKRSNVRPAKMLRVGELASATGVTVRTLHHYEEAGLLKSFGRTDGGHRVFGADGVERIYQIRTMRELGLSLAEISEVLSDGGSTKCLLTAHLAAVEQDIERLHLLRDRLRSLTSQEQAPANTEELIATLDAMSRVERHGRKRKDKSAIANMGGAAEIWRQLGTELRACMDAGCGPRDERPRQLAGQAQSLIEQFADGDSQIVEALRRLRGASPPCDLVGWDPKLIQYLDAAIAGLNIPEGANE
jgi:DNA-binding transcriptional MerR regulator